MLMKSLGFIDAVAGFLTVEGSWVPVAVFGSRVVVMPSLSTGHYLQDKKSDAVI